MQAKLYFARISTLVGLIGLTASLCSCDKDSPIPDPQPEYYPFTTADQQWMRLTPTTQWVFENQRHQRRTYSVSQVQHQSRQPLVVKNYLGQYVDGFADVWTVRFQRTDTAAAAGYLELSRMPLGNRNRESRLVSLGYWADFVGYENNTRGLHAHYLNQDGQPDFVDQVPQSLTVRGVVYQHVVAARSSAIAIERRRNQFPGAPEQTIGLEYDQVSGLVRFVTLNGDVWERLP